MTEWLDAPLLELSTLDLESAGSVTYLLHQTFRYEYDAPAYDVRQRLVALPRRRHGSLVRRAAHVSVTGAAAPETATVPPTVTGAAAPDTAAIPPAVTGGAVPGTVTGAAVSPVVTGGAAPETSIDAAGNEVVSVRLAEVPVAVEFTLAALAERTGPAADVAEPAAALADPRHRDATALTAPSAELRELAGSLRAAYSDDRELAGVLCERLRTELAFSFDATSVFTTAAEAWAQRAGVCQDFAHIMLTVCRLAGIPSRYVSGHLLGERGGSHAWVEVLVPSGDAAVAVGFDPTNGVPSGARHLPVAIGRDYHDVAPTSGVYSGTARGTLTWTKRSGVTAIHPTLVPTP